MNSDDIKLMDLRRGGVCECGAALPAGTRAGWDRVRKVVVCRECLARDGISLGAAGPAVELAAAEPVDVGPVAAEPVAAEAVEMELVDVGTPGGSLDREYARRSAARQERVLRRFPRAGRFLLRIAPEPETTRAFAIGAEGERAAAAYLERKLGPDALFLYNRRLGAGRNDGDIDIIVVVATGVFVVDPKRYAGKRVRTDRSGATFLIDGRRRPKLAVSMRRHLDAVAAAVAAGPVREAPVRAAYCFIGSDLPWLRISVDGVPALTPRSLAKTLAKPGSLHSGQRSALHQYLHEQFPPA